MPDNKAKRGKPDRTRINVNEKYELAYWKAKLGVSDAEIRRVVKLVGPMVNNVKASLALASKRRPDLTATLGDGTRLAVPAQLNIAKQGRRICTLLIGERDVVIMLERQELPIKVTY